MKAKSVIKKIFTFLAFVVAGGSVLTLLIAANQKQKAHTCRELAITIKADGDQYFIDKDDILSQLLRSANGNLVAKPVHEINLAKLEQQLEKGAWIRDAELYFDSRDVLHVVVTERQPIARVFTTNGNSFYIDSSGHHMPLLEDETARVLVVTNFTGAKVYNAADSAMAENVRVIANAIYNNEFWKEQIGQLDITPRGSYEAIPVIGNHIIRFGSATDIDKKLRKLFVFYKQVLSKTGFDKYGIIDLQYQGQIVGVHPEQISAIDSLQLQKNIQELLEKSNLQMLQDSVIQYLPKPSNDSTINAVSPAPVDTTRSNPPKPATLPVNTNGNSVNRARAVMPARQ